jgi:hypothetical protein
LTLAWREALRLPSGELAGTVPAGNSNSTRR